MYLAQSYQMSARRVRWNEFYLSYHAAPILSEYLEGLDIPFPDILSYLVIMIEAGGPVFLLIGLFVRWVSIPMICLMLFAILMVHLENGWSNENNGIEFAVTYILMLFILLFSGGGKFLSLDFWVSKNK